MTTDNILIRPSYVDRQRLLDLLFKSESWRKMALQVEGLQAPISNLDFANQLAPMVLDYLREEKIYPIHRVAAEGRLAQGCHFTYVDHLYASGFGKTNRSQNLTLGKYICEISSGTRLEFKCTKDGLTTSVPDSELRTAGNCFAFAVVTEIGERKLEAVPYLVGDLVEHRPLVPDLSLAYGLRLEVRFIDQFRHIDFTWKKSDTVLNTLEAMPTTVLRETFLRLLASNGTASESWEMRDEIIQIIITIAGKPYRAAVMVRGYRGLQEPRFFDAAQDISHIQRLFAAEADVYILQQSDRYGLAVARTMEAYAISDYSARKRFVIVSPFDTAKILHGCGLL
jgi:hypothetical protein